MPNVKQMFPRRYMSHEDLERGKMYSGTIKAVVLIQAKARPGGFGQPGMPGALPPVAEEPEWALVFHEYPKPMRLKVSKANLLAFVIGSEETEHWIGRQIQFYRGQIDIGGRPQECILIDQTPIPVGPALAASTATGFKATGRKIPADAVKRFRDTVESFAKKWDDFLAWLKTVDAGALAACWGTDLNELDSGLLSLMKRYLDMISVQPAAPAAPAALPPKEPTINDVFNPRGKGPPISEWAGRGPVGEEDIPF